jgi:hypothetical protein
MQKFKPLFGKACPEPVEGSGRGDFCENRAEILRRTLLPGHYRKSELSVRDMPIDGFEQCFNPGAVRRVLAPMRKKGDAFAID